MDTRSLRFVTSILLAAALAAPFAGCRDSSGPVEDDLDACSSICSCVAGQGLDANQCLAICQQVAVVSSSPAADCVGDLSQVGAGACSSQCSGLVNPVPGDERGRCGSDVPSMGVGDELACDFGASVLVDYVALSVGCNDGETGGFLVTFDDDTSVSLTGTCGNAVVLSSPVRTSGIRLAMTSGGGADGVISLTDYGSAGFIVGYR